MPRTKTKGRLKTYEEFKYSSQEFCKTYAELKSPERPSLFNSFVFDKNSYRFIGEVAHEVFRLKSLKGIVFIVHVSDVADPPLRWTVSEWETGRTVIPKCYQPDSPTEARRIAKQILKQVGEEFYQVRDFYLKENLRLLLNCKRKQRKYPLRSTITITGGDNAKNHQHKRPTKDRPTRRKRAKKSFGLDL